MNLRVSPLSKVWALVSKYGLRAGLQNAVAHWARSRLSAPHDVLQEYGWVLNEDRSPELAPPKTGPLRINWMVPSIAKGSGGLLNIFRVIHYLEQWGHENRIYVLGNWAAGGKGVQDFVQKSYLPIHAPIEAFTGRVVDSDALVATNWMTAYAVRALANTAQKFYLVQDLEHYFHASGSLAEFAKETYRWGIQGITLGNWIAEVLESEIGMPCSPFGFSYDREIYTRNGDLRRSEGKKRVLFYARPNTERRGFELGVLALSLVAKRRPDIEVVLVGFPPRKMRFPFSAVFPGIVSPAELAAWYRRSDIALVLSHTNVSMLPLELMACGCAVVSNNGANVEWLLSDEVCQISDPNPRSLAEAMLELFEDDQLRLKKIAAGIAFAERTDWGTEVRKIEAAFYRGLNLRLDNSVLISTRAAGSPTALIPGLGQADSRQSGDRRLQHG
jgi:glycosyltransferase involved in cell wall biosynthesis